MGLDTCMKCIKYSLFVFNFIFWLAGSTLAGFGIYVFVSAGSSNHLAGMGDSYRLVAYALIIIGSVIMLLGFLGCCGALLENKCMLVTFFILMTLIFIALCAAGIVVIFMRATVVHAVRLSIHNATHDYHHAPSNSSRDFMDDLQESFKCCGADGANDYNGKVPPSCHSATDPGCVKVFEGSFTKYWTLVVVSVFTTAVVTLLGMIFSMMLCCALRDLYD